ncbi:hypothetical protein [Desulfosporosinus fructosivorans]
MFKFLGILFFLLFFASLIATINPKWVKGNLTRKKTLLSAAISFILFFAFVVADGGSDTAPTPASNPSQAETNNSTPTAAQPKLSEPQPSEQQQFDFAKAELTKDNIKKAISKIIPEQQITEITIEPKDGGNIVDIHYNPGAVWSAKTFVQGSATKAVEVFEILLTHPQITKVWVWSQNELADPKGNTKVEDVMNVALSKETAKDINWKNFKLMVSGDYNKLLDIADGKFIHPAITQELNK